MPFPSIKPKLNIAHCILQRKPLGSYTMLPITIGVYFSISYSWMLLLNSFFVQSYYDEKRRSPSSSSSQVEESYLPCTVDQHGPRISFDLHGPRAMDNIRLAPSLRPAQQLVDHDPHSWPSWAPHNGYHQVTAQSSPRTVDHHGPRIRFDHHGPRTMDIRLPSGLCPAQLVEVQVYTFQVEVLFDVQDYTF